MNLTKLMLKLLYYVIIKKKSKGFNDSINKINEKILILKKRKMN